MPMKFSTDLEQSLNNLYDLIQDHFHLSEDVAQQLLEYLVSNLDSQDNLVAFCEEERILEREMYIQGE